MALPDEVILYCFVYILYLGYKLLNLQSGGITYLLT